jgi:hypothetical protein
MSGASHRHAAKGACRARYAGAARSTHMLDIVMLAIVLVFFALSVGYTVACDRL